MRSTEKLPFHLDAPEAHATGGISAAALLRRPLFLRIVGAWRRTAQSRMWRLLTKDREAAARSVEDVLSWDFDRLVMAHGDPVDGGARERVASALAWIAAGTRPRLPPAGER
jgi:hypothetical protein